MNIIDRYIEASICMHCTDIYNGWGAFSCDEVTKKGTRPGSADGVRGFMNSDQKCSKFARKTTCKRKVDWTDVDSQTACPRNVNAFFISIKARFLERLEKAQVQRMSTSKNSILPATLCTHYLECAINKRRLLIVFRAPVTSLCKA
jgi:hypothetical protein